VRAARVAGVEIPNNKRAETALTYVFGIGNTTAKKVGAAPNPCPQTKMSAPS